MADIVCYKSDGQILDYYTQWDVGQKLILKGVDLASAPYFYFTNSFFDIAYVKPSVVENGAISVDVPDILLQNAIPLIVYISISPDGDIGTTEYAVRIPVMPRVKPNDYVYNPESGGSGSGSGGSSGEYVTIINNLTTNDASMALSAAQGVVLKALVDTLNSEKVDVDELETKIDNALAEAIANGEIGVGGTEIHIEDNLTTEDPNAALSAYQGVVIKGLLDDLYDKKADRSELSSAIDSALSDAIENGEISGVKGDKGDTGADGRGIVDVKRTSGNGSAGSTDIYTITYTDNTTSTFSVYNGANGVSGGSDTGSAGGTGENGATFIPHVDSLGNLSWENDKELVNPDPVNIKGEKGDTGVGITSAEQVISSKADGGRNVFEVTLSDGTTSTIEVLNGSRGGDGADGQTGNDGISITSVEQTTTSTEDGGVNIITVTLSDDHTFTFQIRNGTKGSNGIDGANGFSPTIDVTSITDGSRLTITDVDGEKTVDIMDGKTGATGEAGYTPVRGLDYYTDTDKEEMVGLVRSSMPEYMPVILTSDYYGTSLPDPGAAGRLFFLIEE